MIHSDLIDVMDPKVELHDFINIVEETIARCRIADVLVAVGTSGTTWVQ
jgi:hypothetical protein